MNLKQRMKKGDILLGTWITINHPDVVDALSELPFDWFVFDLEHAPLDISNLEILLMPLKNTGIAPLARAPWNDMIWIKRILDVGVEGIVAPWINSGREAELFVKYATYPPKGLRGVGPRRAIRYGNIRFDEYYKRFETEDRVLIAQIETRDAIENVEDIVSVDGIDGAYIGPMDLSVNLGIPLQYSHPIFEEAITKVLKVCQKYDKTPGIHGLSLELVRKYIDMGFRFIAIMSDIGVMLSGFRNILQQFNRSK
ncbi:2-dehydro-3-deoxyglucarate aldolase [Ignisphaera aggregans DSM 17230]|uniref:2-dehydro-3-deoxyglucarate aldolase n=1 Tax=Ignisphaera aggregans (strain DSM 17230 / JCM 13409 / AQ1.S1) TaxID=583356 RepID=E0SR67_IGNAA|nr:2-dehydro-3-deoxyglucarate aldolase [Ignisphaera aggregans DSM 17230]